jgi:hypothetical protein
MNRTDCRELRDTDLDVVGGGMKWQRGTVNPDVIDARGELVTPIGTFTVDARGMINGFIPRT